MGQYKIVMFALATLLVLVLGAGAIIHLKDRPSKSTSPSNSSSPPKEEAPWASLPDEIHQHEAQLLHLAELVRAHEDYQKEFDALKSQWTQLAGPISVDDNGNVYFVLSSNVFANAGIICRKKEPFLGDSFEPKIRETKHLFNAWWFYRAS